MCFPSGEAANRVTSPCPKPRPIYSMLEGLEGFSRNHPRPGSFSSLSPAAQSISSTFVGTPSTNIVLIGSETISDSDRSSGLPVRQSSIVFASGFSWRAGAASTLRTGIATAAANERNVSLMGSLQRFSQTPGDDIIPNWILTIIPVQSYQIARVTAEKVSLLAG